MIKKYNQFVKENKTNEEFEMEVPAMTLPSLGKPATPEVAPDTTVKPGEAPDTTVKPGEAPSPFRRDKPSTEPETKAEFEGEEEEIGFDKYTTALQSLADAAGVEFKSVDKMVVINGKEVTFPAEDEKYHIKGVRKGFTTVEDVLANVGGENKTIEPSIKDEEALEEEPSFEETEGDLARRDLESEMGQFESKSYKHKRYKK